mmetsp:Transcript_14235/g.21295  ORF Transcript_14235/g.21295 Transcript_14235/m.21295 type:complete len:1890 (-) Transcript_14235:130-5799(-)
MSASTPTPLDPAIEERIQKFIRSAFNGDIDANISIEAELSSCLFAQRQNQSRDCDELLEEIRKQGPRQVCQYQFKKNDIVWICRSCQTDETCVQCNECFQNAVHEGHEVYFYHSQAGGCCDCGDAGAWKPEGFCTRHGNISVDPMTNVPDDIKATGSTIVSCIADEWVAYCLQYVKNYDFSNWEGEEGVGYNVVLHSDDVHTVSEVMDAVSEADVSNSETEVLAKRVNDKGSFAQGSFTVGSISDFFTARSRATILAAHNLHVSVVREGEEKRVAAFLATVRWLYRLAQTSDGMCRMVCVGLTIPHLRTMMEADIRLSKDVVAPLHNLYLTLMADQPFKIAISRAYALAFSAVAELYGKGIGTSENSLFGISVQFLNRYMYVEGMLLEYNFLQSVSSSLLKILKPTRDEFATSPILIHRRYNPLIGDLKVIFTLPDTSRFFCGTCMDDMLEIFVLFQYLHPQTRNVVMHVEFESRDWMHAFNLYLGFGSLFDYLVNWYESPSSVEPMTMPNSQQKLPTVFEHMKQVVHAVASWQTKFLESVVWDVMPRMPSVGGHIPLYAELENKSFHLFTHRFFATCIRESCRYLHLYQPLQDMQSYVAASQETLGIVALVDFPLVDIVWECQIRSGMWRRNGQIMLDQILNYAEPPFCRIFKDLDILLIQFLATVYGSNRLFNHIIHRFGLFEYLSSKKSTGRQVDSSATEQLLEEMITFLITLVTELPLPAYENPADRVKIMLRREVVHKLVGGPCTYSDLQETMGLIPDSDKVKSSLLDNVIDSIAEWLEGTALEPSKLRLKERAWSEYDPAFPHTLHKTHQAALESRPKLKYAQPIVPPPPVAHPAFAAARVLLLSDRALLSVVRDIIYSYTASRRVVGAASEAYFYICSEWQLKCSLSGFTKVLQLMTLVMHNAFTVDPAPMYLAGYDRELCGNAGVPSPADRREMLSSFMRESPDVVASTDRVVTLPPLIVCLMDLHSSLSNAGVDDPIKQWVLWVISKVGELCSKCQAIVEERMQKQLDEKRMLELQERRDRARERAMQAMKKSATSFAAHIEGMSDDEDDDVMDTNGEDKLECIVCRDQDNKDHIGYLAFSQASRYFHHSFSEIHLDDVSNEHAKRSPDLHIQFCGHAMHLGCFDSYLAMIIERSGMQNGLILNTNRGQYQCPLCKKIGNVLVPSVQGGSKSNSDFKKTALCDHSGWVKWAAGAEHRPRIRGNIGISSDEESEELDKSADVRGTEEVAMDMESSLSAERMIACGGAETDGHRTGSSLTGSIADFFRRITSSTDGEDLSSGLSGRTTRSLSEGAVHMASAEQNEALRVEKEHTMLFRYLGDLCEPVLGQSPFVETNYYYSSLPDYLRMSLASVSFSLSTDVMDKGAFWHLGQGDKKSTGVDIYQHIGKHVSCIGKAMHVFGIRDVLKDRLFASIRGRALSSTRWPERIILAPSALNRVPTNFLTTVEESWFANPLLAMPLLDAVVLVLSLYFDEEDSIAVLKSPEQPTDAPNFEMDEDFSMDDPEMCEEDGQNDRQTSCVGNMDIVSSIRWICIAYLVQTIIGEMESIKNSPVSGEVVPQSVGSKRHVDLGDEDYECMESEPFSPSGSENDISSWSISEALLRPLVNTVGKHCDCIQSQSTGVDAKPWGRRLGLRGKDISDMLRRILFKWILFVRFSLHVITRCRPDLTIFCPKYALSEFPASESDLTEEVVLLHLRAVGVADLCQDASAVDAVMLLSENWIWAASSYHSQLSAYSHWHYPRATAPHFVALPEAYTKLHGQLTSLCSYDYPAICLTCGKVLDAAGKGQCSAHVKFCGEEVGIFFLLQDCNLLLLFGMRGCYYSAPYVDSHGEKHRHYRGKPLFLDMKRFNMLTKLWATHGIPREVVQKRSTSTRVIINGHY